MEKRFLIAKYTSKSVWNLHRLKNGAKVDTHVRTPWASQGVQW